MVRRLMTLGLALILAAAGAIGLLVYVKRADQRATTGVNPVTVLVAVKAIPVGTSAGGLLSTGLVRSETMPAASVPTDSLTSIGPEIQSMVTSLGIQPGQLLIRPMFVTKSDLSAQGFSVPQGMLAVTVALNDPMRVAGFVGPGSKIAIFEVFMPLRPNGTPVSQFVKATRLLMPDIKVLAIGPAPAANTPGTGATGQLAASTQQAQNNQPSGGPTLVTVAVTQHQAEQLILGTQAISLYLGLETDTSQVTSGPGVDSFNTFQ